MNPRVCLLVALLASPAWSQAPTADVPTLTAKSFDLRDPAVKQIVRVAAATQYGTVHLSEQPIKEPEPPATIRFVPPEAKVGPKQQDFPRLKPAPASTGFLSQVFGIVLDEVLLDGDDSEAAADSDKWLRCEGREPMMSTQLGYDTCPAKNRDHLSPIP
jgi:hypothetical protein